MRPINSTASNADRNSITPANSMMKVARKRRYSTRKYFFKKRVRLKRNMSFL